jgi:hypothetical protein
LFFQVHIIVIFPLLCLLIYKNKNKIYYNKYRYSIVFIWKNNLIFFCKINFLFYFLEKTKGLILMFALGHTTCWAGPASAWALSPPQWCHIWCPCRCSCFIVHHWFSIFDVEVFGQNCINILTSGCKLALLFSNFTDFRCILYA